MNLRQIIYDIREAFNLESDDSSVTNRYIEYLVERAREFILDQKHSDPRNIISESTFQTLHVPINIGAESSIKVPPIIKTTGIVSSAMKAYGVNVAGTLLNVPLNVVSIDRLPYVGNSQFTQDKIFCAVSPDGTLILNSKNNMHKMIDVVMLRALFANPREVFEIEHPDLDFLDAKYPITDIILNDVRKIVDAKLSDKLNYNKDNINNGEEDRNKNS